MRKKCLRFVDNGICTTPFRNNFQLCFVCNRKTFVVQCSDCTRQEHGFVFICILKDTSRPHFKLRMYEPNYFHTVSKSKTNKRKLERDRIRMNTKNTQQRSTYTRSSDCINSMMKKMKARKKNLWSKKTTEEFAFLCICTIHNVVASAVKKFSHRIRQRTTVAHSLTHSLLNGKLFHIFFLLCFLLQIQNPYFLRCLYFLDKRSVCINVCMVFTLRCSDDARWKVFCI